jgi:cytochrome c5
MKIRSSLLAAMLLTLANMLAMNANLAAQSASTASDASFANKVQRDPAAERALRLEGERRFQANCGRCHSAPHKFPPRMMATIVRHMRVRATITDDDMKLILHYMTE